MKKRIFLAIFICFAFNFAFSQSGTYEKGYFIDNNNKRVECLIKNPEWNYNPTEFEYKTDENSVTKTISLNDFQEFGVGQEYKFIRAAVKIDKSSDNIASMSTTKALKFVNETLLLRTRVEGKATLYSYKNDDYTRYFYSLESGSITPLSYKVYYDAGLLANRKNETYKQELFNSLKCSQITENDAKKLEYTESKLSILFTKYNECSGSSNNKFVGKKNHNTFEMHAKLGAAMSDFYFDYGSYKAQYSKKINPKVGVEGEINISNKFKKWSVMVGLLYQQYTDSQTIDYVNPFTAEIDYKAIDVSVGVRRYFVLNPKSYVYLDGRLIYAVSINTKLDFKNSTPDVEGVGTAFPVLSLGYLYNKKYSIELNYELSRNLFQNNSSVVSKYKSISVMLGYKFL